jgi:hypothetical protein
MDAFELTRPILTVGGRAVEPAEASADVLAVARRFVNQLPLGTWPGPAFDGPRWSPGAAAREIERSLVRAAASHGVTVSVDDSPGALAKRLVRARVIVAPAADGTVHLLRALRAGDADGAAVKLADRLLGYLDHRAR